MLEWLHALGLNVQGNVALFLRSWGEELFELSATVLIAGAIYALVTPEKFAPDHRAENKRIRRENRRVARAATRIQSRYRGNRARGRYEAAAAVLDE